MSPQDITLFDYMLRRVATTLFADITRRPIERRYACRYARRQQR